MLTAAITGPVNIRIDQGVDAFLRLRDRATEAASLARAQNDLRQLGNASQVRVYGGYVLGHAAEMEAALEDLLHVGAETHEPFWTWRGYMLGGSRYLMRCDFAAATECVVQSSQLARSFGHVWGQVYDARRLSRSSARVFLRLSRARSISAMRPLRSSCWRRPSRSPG